MDQSLHADLELATVESPRAGRPSVSISVESEGELQAADISALAVMPSKPGPSIIQRISERHHALARALASGMTNREAGFLCGYSTNRVSLLKSDESVQELIAHYRVVPDAAYADLHERLSGMSLDAASEIRRRLEDEPEDIGMSALQNIVTMGADRTGYGPQTKTTNLHIHAGLADRLDQARKRVENRLLTAETAELVEEKES